ncbi:unnamed protein product [Amoebophrya sp. A120]|nr:unnamed protein product [Amoebophrya sp. A120]|eukprot:GSA120T00016619001.1
MVTTRLSMTQQLRSVLRAAMAFSALLLLQLTEPHFFGAFSAPPPTPVLASSALPIATNLASTTTTTTSSTPRRRTNAEIDRMLRGLASSERRGSYDREPGEREEGVDDEYDRDHELFYESLGLGQNELELEQLVARSRTQNNDEDHRRSSPEEIRDCAITTDRNFAQPLPIPELKTVPPVEGNVDRMSATAATRPSSLDREEIPVTDRATPVRSATGTPGRVIGGEPTSDHEKSGAPASSTQMFKRRGYNDFQRPPEITPEPPGDDNIVGASRPEQMLALDDAVRRCSQETLPEIESRDARTRSADHTRNNVTIARPPEEQVPSKADESGPVSTGSSPVALKSRAKLRVWFASDQHLNEECQYSLEVSKAQEPSGIPEKWRHHAMHERWAVPPPGFEAVVLQKKTSDERVIVNQDAAADGRSETAGAEGTSCSLVYVRSGAEHTGDAVFYPTLDAAWNAYRASQRLPVMDKHEQMTEEKRAELVRRAQQARTKRLEILAELKARQTPEKNEISASAHPQ